MRHNGARVEFFSAATARVYLRCWISGGAAEFERPTCANLDVLHHRISRRGAAKFSRSPSHHSDANNYDTVELRIVPGAPGAAESLSKASLRIEAIG
jgi:hypothetical protein